jgi:hypothetical protein
VLEKFNVIIIGKIKAISTSKIKKIIAIKKNRIEKGSREEEKGLNPHSNGESFSCSIKDFFLNNEERVITSNEIHKTIIAKINKFIIIYIKDN